MQTVSPAVIDGNEPVEYVPGYAIVGACFNIFKSYDSASIGTPLFELGELDKQHVKLGDKTYAVPANINAQMSRHRDGRTTVFSSREKLQRHFSAKAHVEASAFAFSGQVDASYSETSNSDKDYFYALTELNTRIYTLSLDDDSTDKLKNRVSKDVAGLPDTFNDHTQAAYFAFFQRYGTHYVAKAEMGSRLYFSVSINKSYSSAEKEVELKVQLEYDGTFASSKAEAESKWKQLDKSWAQNRTVHIRATGGDDSILNALVPQTGKWCGDDLRKWHESLEARPGEANFVLQPITRIFPLAKSEQAGRALEKYINGNIAARAYLRSDPGGAWKVEGFPAITCANITVPVHPPVPAPEPEKRRAGLQAVLFDSDTKAVLCNHAYYSDGYHSTEIQTMYDKVYRDLRAFEGRSYYAALSIYGVFAPNYPSAELSGWLKNHGATLKQWEQQIGRSAADSGFVCYSFVGKSASLVGAAEDFKLSPSNRWTGISSESLARYALYSGGFAYALGDSDPQEAALQAQGEELPA